MREDLNKLLCERERRGSRHMRYKQVRRLKAFTPRDPEDSVAREGMKKRVGYDDKDFSENLNPLYGQVRKAVGKRYDTFYSELSKTFDKRSVINQHILGHLDDFLSREVYIAKDGKLMEHHGKYGGRDLTLAESSSEFYVDPRDGCIRRNKYMRSHARARRERAASAKAEQAKVFRALPDGSELHLIDDIWFLFTVKDAPVGHFVYDKPPNKCAFKPQRWSKVTSWERLREHEKRHCGIERFVGTRVYDMLTGESVFSDPGKPPKKYHATKRTASHKTLKAAGVVA